MTRLLLLIVSVYAGMVNASVKEVNSFIQDAHTQQQADGFDHQIDRVVFIDSKLNRYEINRGLGLPDKQVVKVTTERFGSKSSETGTLKAWAVLKNRTDYDLQLEGRVTFLDAELVPIDGDTSSWKKMYLPANAVGTYRDSSLSFDAQFFMIEIREGR